MAEAAQGVVEFLYVGGACVVAEVQGVTLVFDPDDHLMDDDIAPLREPLITLFTQNLDDHFHGRTAMKLVDMKGSIIVGTAEVCKALVSFVPSTKLIELKPRKGVRVGSLRVFALEGRHEVSTNIYYVTWGPSLIFAGDTAYAPLSLVRAQIAFLPAGGSQFSKPEDAARMAVEAGASYAVPVHCERAEAKRLAELLEGRATVIVPTARTRYRLALK